MIKKVKTWLGIEGVKLELVLPEQVDAYSKRVKGKLRFQSMNTQHVTEIKVVMIEKYIRGRGDEKLIDEYEIGSISLPQDFVVEAGEEVLVDFYLPYSIVKSSMDEMGDKNLLFKGVSRLAKLAYGAKSTYRIEAEAAVKGVALNPFDKKKVDLVF